MSKTNPIVIQERQACEHQRKLRRFKRQERIKQTASQEQPEKQNTQVETPGIYLMEPWDSGPEKEKGKDTAKTLEESPRGRLADNATIPPTSNTSKPQSDAATLTPLEENWHAKLWGGQCGAVAVPSGVSRDK